MSDLVSLKISQKGTSGSDLQIGGVFAQEMSLEIFWDEIDGDYKKYTGSLIGLSYGVKTSNSESYSTCPFNVFEVSKTERKAQTIVLTAYDFMLKLEKTFNGWDDNAHGLYDWYLKICTDCEVNPGMSETEFKALTNILPVGAVTIKPGGVFTTYRDIAHYIAVLIGGYAFIRGVSLYFAAFADRSADFIIPQNLIDGGDKYSDYAVRYTTVTAIHGDTLISATLSGATGRTYELGEIPFLEEFQSDTVYQNVVNNILANLSQIAYTPFDIKWTGNPALECGDFVNIDDTSITSPITSIDWEFDRMEALKSVGTESETVQIATSPAKSAMSKEIQQVKQTFATDLTNYATKRYVDDVAGINIDLYANQLNFTAAGFNIGLSDDSSNVYIVNEDTDGNITSIVNNTLGQTMEVLYDE